ncbi:MAG: hypothetical protein ACLR5G_15020 [Eubacteriales bacterium]
MPNKLEYNIAVADMAPGDNIEGFYILKDASIRTTSNGKAFLAGALSDSTGVIDLKVWDYTGPLGTDKNDIGRVIKVRGEVGEFKGSPSVLRRAHPSRRRERPVQHLRTRPDRADLRQRDLR